MNFLAHLYLSGSNNDLRAGNFIGDFVKGKDIENFSDEVKQGILLHRSIDFFTDRHPVVAVSKNRIRQKYGHYASVIVDIYYDHFLAKNWNLYSEVTLLDYSLSFYRNIDNYSSVLPDNVNTMLFYMKQDNWLCNYQYLTGIERTFMGLSRRTKFESKMENAHLDLLEHYHDFESEFLEFFPLLNNHCIEFIDNAK